MIRRSMPPTTHTLEMAQVADLNERLKSRDASTPITAADIGMGGAPLDPGGTPGLSDHDILTRVSWQGSPEFPDIYGHFGQSEVSVLMHTAALNQLGHKLNLRQRWGIGITPTTHQ